MKINPISTRIISYNNQKNVSNNNSVSFAATPLKPSSKDIHQIISNRKGKISRQQLKYLKMYELNILNFRTVNSTSVSGGTFSVRSDIDLKTLKDAGIKTIIDFRGEATSDFAKRCQESGFDYFNFNLNNVINMINSDYFIREKNEKIKISPKLIEKLEEFFKITNEGNVYMGCQFGIDRTNIALFMNYLMNPKVDNAPTILTWPYEKKKTVANKNIKVVKKIIKRMTPEQRKQLGIPEDYYSMLQTRIYDLLKKNNLL